jgi:histone deacetylase 11
LNLSGNGIIRRDEFIFSIALELNIPILMVLSGGYQKSNAPVIAESIENLINKFDLLGRAKNKMIL